MNIPKRLVLASQSPRRASLLRQIGLTFDIIPSHISEDHVNDRRPHEIVLTLSRAKAYEIAQSVQNAIIIGADTVVVLDGKILGKPITPTEAITMLHSLSGREHEVYTGFTLLDTPSMQEVSSYEKTLVRFRHLHDEEIASYVASGSPMDKAGAYGIQDDYGAVFVESITGCFYNVVGFPLTKFFVTLQEFLST
ncbi:MAG: Maf family protein [Bacteroidota bacterium]